MRQRKITRRRFLKISGIAVPGFCSIGLTPCLANRKPDLQDLTAQLSAHLPDWNYSAEDIKFRFIVGGDPHFGWGRHYEDWWQEWIDWVLLEKEQRGLDLLFLNGDIVHDRTDLYGRVQDYLSQIKTPIYLSKGNHDFLADDQSWQDLWGHPENHVLRIEDKAFVIADTSIGINNRDHYSAACHEWLKEALASVSDVPHVFVIMHIAQRKQGVEVDGYRWPQYGVGHQGHEDVGQGERNMALIEAQPNVRAVFHSHNHRKVERFMSGGKPYFFCGRLGGNLLGGNTLRGYRVFEHYHDGKMATYQWNLEERIIMTAHWVDNLLSV